MIFRAYVFKASCVSRQLSAQRPLVALFVLLFAGSQAAADIEIIAVNGAPAPDGNGTLSKFSAPTLSATGQPVFLAELTGTAGGAADSEALYRRDSAGLTRIVRRGTSVVDGKTVTAFFPSPNWIDASGKVTTIVGLGSPPQTQIVTGSGGVLSYLIAPGSPSPTGNGNNLLAMTSATVNDAGAAVYTALYTGVTPEIGLYYRAPNGALSTLLLRNQTAPRGGTIMGVNRGTLNESSQVSTLATIDSSLITSALRIDGAVVEELARQGDLAADGVTTLGGILSSPAINASGQLAFPAEYTQPGQSRRGVFIADNASLRLVGPGVLPGNPSSISEVRVAGISSDGLVGFWAELGGGIDPPSGMYVANDAGPTAVALEDSPIPSGGKFFSRFFTDAIAFSDSGGLAFLAELSDVVNGAVTGRGLFFYKSDLGLVEVVKTGDSLLGSTIASSSSSLPVRFYGSTSLSSLQGSDSSLTGLTAAGRVGFGFTLVDSTTGVAIWSPPEASLPADFDEDGDVDSDDLTAWGRGFGMATGASRALGDSDGDGDADGGDFLTWQQQYGSDGVAASASRVPEPAATGLMIAAVGVLGFLGWHARAKHGGVVPKVIFFGVRTSGFGVSPLTSIASVRADFWDAISRRSAQKSQN